MSVKTKDQLLLDYRKANKVARKKILTKQGYATEADYLAFLMAPDAVKEEETDMLDQVIAFDTTGSMSGYIAQVKKHVQDLIPKLFKENPNLRLKVVAFGDYCDMINKNIFGKAYQETQLTDNENSLINFVKNAENTSGGDGDEFYELVLKKVIDETPWREDSKRALLLIGDCGPHLVGYSYGTIVKNAQIDWKQEAAKASKIGLQVDTLNCGPHWQESFYKPLSAMTNGINIPFSSQEKTHHAVYAATSVRGSKLSKRSFEASYDAAMKSGDSELIGTYKSLSGKL